MINFPDLIFFGGGGQREGHGGSIWPKKPKMELISEYLAADASADALAIINIGNIGPYNIAAGVLPNSAPIAMLQLVEERKII